MNIKDFKKKANIKCRNNKDVYFGDEFITGEVVKTKVKVVKDVSKENLECDRNFDVEDEEGNRIWNAYMVIKHDRRVSN